MVGIGKRVRISNGERAIGGRIIESCYQFKSEWIREFSLWVTYIDMYTGTYYFVASTAVELNDR